VGTPEHRVVRKRNWQTDRGEIRQAWVVDCSDQLGHRHLKTFARKRDAEGGIQQRHRCTIKISPFIT
jgi:hypothetical protein